MQSIKDLPGPKMFKEVIQMLDLTGYYDTYMPAYADLVKPLTQVTHKIAPLIWTYQCQKTFVELKGVLMESPILVYPNPNKPHTLFMDVVKICLVSGTNARTCVYHQW